MPGGAIPPPDKLAEHQAAAKERARRNRRRVRARINRIIAKRVSEERQQAKAEIEAQKIVASVPLIPFTKKGITPEPIPWNKRNGKTYRSSADTIRRFLEDGRRGALNEKGQTRLIGMIDRMHQIAMSDSPRNVQAFTALMERAYGKPKPSEEALDALAKGGVQIVYVAPPELPEAETKALPPKPEFINAEFTEEDQ